MCTIDAYYVTVNDGKTPTNCKAAAGDQLEIELVVSFTAAEVYKTVIIDVWGTKDGVADNPSPLEYYVANSGTHTIQVMWYHHSEGGAPAGTYKATGCRIYEKGGSIIPICKTS